MDMQLPFFPSILCVRCGALFQPEHPALPCPRCGLPARFSLPPGATPLPEEPLGDPGRTAADSSAASPVPSPAASSSRIPVAPVMAAEPPFSEDEMVALLRLRQRYQQGNRDVSSDGFSAAERARLSFVRWLYQSGRIAA